MNVRALLPLLLAAGLALSAPTVVYGGPPQAQSDAAAKLVGTWRMVPEAPRLRQLKIIDAAISGNAGKKEKLGTLSADEQKLFAEWSSGKSPDELRKMNGELRFAKNCVFEFTATEVTVRFDQEVFGPSPYKVVSATDAATTIQFDPKLGNGMETHSFEWTGPSKGVDHIKASDGTEFAPLNVSRG
jgi:hypothetical protein